METMEDFQGSSPADSLREDIRQTRPFRSRAHEAVLSLFRTVDEVRHRYADVFAVEDITAQQYNVLRILRGAGDGGLPTLEIGQRMIERTPGVTRIVDRLERKGLVRRVRDTQDRRRVWCRVTQAGLDVIDRLEEPVMRMEEELLGGISEERVDRLLCILADIRAQSGATV